MTSAGAQLTHGRALDPPGVPSPAPGERAGVRVGVVLTLAMAYSCVLPFAFGALAPALMTDLGLSRTGVGALVTGVYGLAAAVSLVVGRVVDRRPPRHGLIAIFLLTGLALSIAAIAESVLVLVLSVLVGGVAAALGNPSTNLVIARARELHPLIVGVKQSGVQLGSFFAGAVLVAIAAVLDWRAALALLGASAVVAMLTVAWVPGGPRAGAGTAAAPAAPWAVTPFIRTVAAYAFLMGTGLACVNTYLPLYAVERNDVPGGTAGLLLAVVGVTGVVSRIAWGLRGDAGERDAGVTARPLGPLACGAVAAIGLFLAGPVIGAWALWVGALALGATASAWNAVAMLALLRHAPATAAARAASRVLVLFFAGLAVGPLLFGTLLGLFDSYAVAWALASLGFASAAITAWRWRR